MFLELNALLVLGIAIVAAAWIPVLTERLPLTLPMVAVGSGYLLGPSASFSEYLSEHIGLIEQLTEFVLIVAVMGAGLRIDEPFSLSSWSPVWRLLGIVMPISIAVVTIAGVAIAGFPLAASLLLGAALAPTDPVLASSVQVGPPGAAPGDQPRFSLTAEAGLNDGTAFPFVTLAILLNAHQNDFGSFALEWLAVELVWKTVVGSVIGFALGWALVQISHRVPERFRLAKSESGLVAIGLTFLSYAATQLLDGYGFVSVFATAVTLRNFEYSSEYAVRLHDFTEQLQRLAMVLVLFFFGISIADGILAPLGWKGVAVGLLTLFVARPVATAIAFQRSHVPIVNRAIIGYFGIRGLASFYYMAHATQRGPFAFTEKLWAVVAFVVLTSIVVYGVSVNPVMRKLEARVDPGSR